MSTSVGPHRRQPIRLPHPWDSPGKNTGVGCHFLLQCMKVKRESEVAQSCPTLCDPMDCSLPGSSVWVVTITLKIFSSAVSNLKIELFYLISLVIQVVLCPLVAIRIGRWEAYFNQNERADLIETGDRSWTWNGISYKTFLVLPKIGNIPLKLKSDVLTSACKVHISIFLALS